MKPEPLKGKKKTMYEYPLGCGFLAFPFPCSSFSYKDVKSAVEWLLNEFDKIDAIVLETEGFIENRTPADLDEVILGTLNYVKHLIKTAFEDVMEGGDEHE